MKLLDGLTAFCIKMISTVPVKMKKFRWKESIRFLCLLYHFHLFLIGSFRYLLLLLLSWEFQAHKRSFHSPSALYQTIHLRYPLIVSKKRKANFPRESFRKNTTNVLSSIKFFFEKECDLICYYLQHILVLSKLRVISIGNKTLHRYYF